MSDVSPTDKSGGVPYKAQYEISPQFRKFWQKLFHSTDLTDKELHQMTDQFVKNISDNMNQVLNWALKEQKKRDQKEKEQG